MTHHYRNVNIYTCILLDREKETGMSKECTRTHCLAGLFLFLLKKSLARQERQERTDRRR